LNKKSAKSTCSPIRYLPEYFLFRIFGDLENCTFSETLGPTEFEKQYIFSKHPMAAILDFQNGGCLF